MSLIVVVLTIAALWGCGSIAPSLDESQADANSSSGVFVGGTNCRQDTHCEQDCREAFVGNSQLVDRCQNQKVSEVKVIKEVMKLIKNGAWASIKEDKAEIALEFDRKLWLDYVDVNKEKAKNFLAWVAEHPRIAKLLDTDGEALERAFMGIVLLGSKTERIFAGMQTDVNKDKRQTFFEMAVLNDNDDAFKSAHRLLADTCEKRQVCVRRVYCSIYKDLIFARINTLDLVEDVANSNSVSIAICN